MVVLEDATLWLHIAAGVIALLAGLGALVTTKGGRRHRKAGRTFVASMGIVVGTVFGLLVFDPTPSRIFLTLIGVFSGYFAFSGYRVLARKRLVDEAHAIDWAAAVAVVIVCFALGGWGISSLVSGNSLGIVMILFSLLGIGAGLSDLQTFRDATRQGPWMINHLSRMVGAYIATVTAVSVINLTILPQVITWLWPTVLGVPLIWFWERKYGDTGPLVHLAPR